MITSPFIILLFVSFISYAGSLEFFLHNTTSDSALAEYIASRDNCVWVEKGTIPCGIAWQECIVEATVAEGTGYYYITRYGPITTTGGIQNVECYNRHLQTPEPGSWYTRHLTAPVDPYTGQFIDFPPIHLHHSNSRNGDEPPIPKDVMKHMPWMSMGEKVSFALAWITSAAADNMCIPAVKGKACIMKLYPDGYGRKIWKKKYAFPLSLHIQDVRLDGSPPMTSYVESMHFYVTKMNPQRSPLKPSLDLCLEVSGKPPPHTVELMYNTSMYTFVTYYFPMTVVVNLMHFHAHSVNGDEGWIVRGNQHDLGIPLELHREVRSKGGYEVFGAVYDPIPVHPPDSMSALKRRMEQSLAQAAAEYESGRQHHKDSGGASSSWKSRHQHGYEFIPFSEERYSNYKAPDARNKPEILCKLRADNLQYSLDDVREEKRKWHQQYNDIINAGEDSMLQRGRPIIQVNELVEFEDITLDKRVSHPEPIDQSTYTAEGMNMRPAILKAVSAKEQSINRFTGILPGEYYRHLLPIQDNSRFSEHEEEAGQSLKGECQNFVIKAGEYITVVHFNEPRLKPSTTAEYSNMETTINQHTIVLAQGEIPRFPFLK